MAEVSLDTGGAAEGEGFMSLRRVAACARSGDVPFRCIPMSAAKAGFGAARVISFKHPFRSVCPPESAFVMRESILCAVPARRKARPDAMGGAVEGKVEIALTVPFHWKRLTVRTVELVEGDQAGDCCRAMWWSGRSNEISGKGGGLSMGRGDEGQARASLAAVVLGLGNWRGDGGVGVGGAAADLGNRAQVQSRNGATSWDGAECGIAAGGLSFFGSPMGCLQPRFLRRVFCASLGGLPDYGGEAVCGCGAELCGEQGMVESPWPGSVWAVAAIRAGGPGCELEKL